MRVREWPLMSVLAGIGVGLGFVLADHWREGLFVFGLALGGATLARVTLPARTAGLLVVRAKGFDVAVLAALTGAVLLLARVVPA